MPAYAGMTVMLLRCLRRFLRLLFVVLDDGRHRGADEFFLVVAGPVEGFLALGIGAVDHRRDVALPQLVGLLGVLEIGPIVRELEEDAEFALLGLEAADLRDGV